MDTVSSAAATASSAVAQATASRYDSHKLVTLGIMMGILHVLAGPDHLCALATLSVGSSWRAALLGFRWGLGHSTGLVVVFVFFTALQHELDLKTIGRYADAAVGLLMVVLGGYGAVASTQNYRLKKTKRTKDEESQIDNENIRGKDWCDLKDPTVQKIIAFVIGTVHGIGGPGGVLGVLPVVELNDYTASGLYILSFAISSTICMGAFAALYGELTKRLGATADAVEFYINIFSCALSIIVGMVWFVMSVNGNLEKLFH